MAQDKPFGEMVGLCVKFTQGEPAEAIKDLRELGINWLRRHVDWDMMEPTPGNYVAAFPSGPPGETGFLQSKWNQANLPTFS